MPAEKLPEMRVVSRFGFVDLELSLSELRRGDDGRHYLSARGRYQDQDVGFGMILGPWKRAGVYWGEAQVVSLGAVSDAFVRVLDQQLYGTNLARTTMRQNVPCTAIALGGEPAHAAQEPVELKMFFDSGGEERYAEFFVNIEPVAMLVQVREKDSAYRRGFVLSLAAD